MPIQFNCPKCSKRLSVPDSFAGKKARCPGCNEALDVPLISQLDAAPAHDDRPIIGDRAPIMESLELLTSRLDPKIGRIGFVIGFLIMVASIFAGAVIGIMGVVLGALGLIVVSLSLSVLIDNGNDLEKQAAMITSGIIIMLALSYAWVRFNLATNMWT